MNTPVHSINSEIAYDLLQDNIGVVLALIDRPMARHDVISLAGDEKVVTRLEKYGLIRAEDDRMVAVSSTYQQVRQEGMLSFLERYVLPSLSASATPDVTTSLQTRYLFLPDELRFGWVPGPAQDFLEQLSKASDLPAKGATARLSVLVVGTSEVHADELDTSDQALVHLRSASMLRARSETRDGAVLSQFDCLADAGRLQATRALSDSFLERFEEHRSSPEDANFHLTVASHWRGADRVEDMSKEVLQ